MDARARRTQIDRTVSQRGYALVSVPPELPGVAGWSYTVGLSCRGLSDLMVFGLPAESGEALLADLASDVADGRPVTSAALNGTTRPLRLDTVLDWWQIPLVPAGLDWAQHPIALTQVVWTDERGRWPEDPEVCAGCAGRQPRFSTDDPWWPRVVRHPRPAGEPTELVYALVLDLDREWNGQWEALPAAAAGRDRVRIESVPFHRVGCTFGDVVRVEWEPCRDGVRRVIGDLAARPSRRTVRVELTRADDLRRDTRGTWPLLQAFVRLKEHPYEYDDPADPTYCFIAIPQFDRDVDVDAALLAARGLLEYR